MITANPAPPTVASGYGDCGECGHTAAGVRMPAWVNRRLVKQGQLPVYARCDAVLADHGFGDIETCDCVAAAHALSRRTD